MCSGLALGVHGWARAWARLGQADLPWMGCWQPGAGAMGGREWHAEPAGWVQ